MRYQLAGIRKGRMDWILFISVVILLLIGTLAIFSSVVILPYQTKIIRTHLLAIPIGLIFFVVVWGLNYQIFQDQWKFVYAAILISLVGVLIFGSVDRGSMAWYRLPFFSIQPSEFARIGLILVLANYLDRRINKIKEFYVVLGAFFISFPVFFLLMRQPDFSAILLTLPIVLIMLFCAGANIFHLLVIIGYAFLSAVFPILWSIIAINPELKDSFIVNLFFSLSRFGLPTLLFVAGVCGFTYLLWWLSVRLYAQISGVYLAGAAVVVLLGFFSGMMVKSQIKEYQQKRLEVFLAPESDPKGAGYNLIQAKIAIGSGGVFGKGVFSGTQSRLGFVPERHTDFVLAVIGEEMGFWGMMLVIGFYILLMKRLIITSHLARDRFGYLTICGIFGMFMVYFFINFGMLLGLSPVAGVPLPLLSYGGSNLVATLTAIGIVESIYSRRYALT